MILAEAEAIYPEDKGQLRVVLHRRFKKPDEAHTIAWYADLVVLGGPDKGNNLHSSTLVGTPYAEDALEEILNAMYDRNYATSTKAGDVEKAKEEAKEKKRLGSYYGPQPSEF